jgi:leader peptidase (prepilin peptidase) / N-methyltransferase
VGWLWLGLAAVLGAAASSFLQVAVDRAAAGGGSLAGRSRCPHCRAVLRVREVLPVLSFVMLHGRCGACARPIPRRHLLVELAGAVVWGVTAGLFGPTWWLLLALVLPAAAVLVAVPAVRRRGLGTVLPVLLPVTGTALLVVGVGGAVTGRWELYLAAGTAAVLALTVAVRLEAAGPRRVAI